MLRLRAGYYIDEIYFGLWKYLSSDADLLREYFLSSSIQTGIKDENNYLHKIIDQLPNGNDDDEILREKTKQLYDNFFSGLTYFEIDGLSTSGTKDEIDPIVGVCYNVLSRGYPTRAPLKVVEYFLNKNFKEYYLGPEPRDNYGIKYVLYDSLWDSIKVKDVLNIILKQIPSDSEYLAENCGLGLFQIFESLKDLTSIAYIQKSILAALITQTISLDKSIISLYINEISKEISDLAISDLNDLLFHLFRLREADEIAPKLELRDELKHTDLALNFTREKISHPLSLEIKSTYVNQNAHTSFFTTSKIRYKELGTQNTQDENQEFKFHYKESEESLIYFLQNLLRKKEFWPGQLAIINRALQGKDIIGLLPTGGGKSLTYQLCGLLQPGITIIIDPINSLMHDQYEKLCDNGITNSAYMNSLNSYKYEDYRSRVSNGEFLFFLISPERFYMNKFRETLQSTRENNYYFSYGVVDEAHCVSEWGHDFRHVYLGLADNMRRFCSTHENSDLTIFGLTATASFDVLADVQRELVLSEDSIITLPPKAIDRINLKFEINKVIIQEPDPQKKEDIDKTTDLINKKVKLDKFDSETLNMDGSPLKYWEVESFIGKFKYPRIKKFAEQLPDKLKKISSSQSFFREDVTKFYESDDQGYFKNAGIIFCPTKSKRVKNGVESVYDYINEDFNFIKPGTFFSTEDGLRADRVNPMAKQSLNNQKKFIANKLNLMIATKSFGMGIDKPNIRFSIHYSMPSSVESFYQEAGRSGRDGHTAICSIFYHPLDLWSNIELMSNSFKGRQREHEIFNELLNDIKYEENFFVNVISGALSEKFNKQLSANLYPKDKPNVLFINGPWQKEKEKRINYGFLRLDNLSLSQRSLKNADQEISDEILKYAQNVIREMCDEHKTYAEWLQSTSAPGIEEMIRSNPNAISSLPIGFTNGMVQHISKLIGGKDWYFEYENLVKEAYKFSKNADEFIDRLGIYYDSYRYKFGVLNLNEDVKKYIHYNYWKIRDVQDTFRIIYRLHILGIIDDYVIDYSKKAINITFCGKQKEEYSESFRTYLRRYLGVESTEEEINKVDTIQEESLLKRYLIVLTDFVNEHIYKKRWRGIKYMNELCELGTENGDTAFRDSIVFYFTSKYARLDYLPHDTENGQVASIDIVDKYLGYVFDPPDGLGSQLDNTKHLRGACARLQIGQYEDNATLNLLNAFSLFALEGADSDDIELIYEKPTIKEAVKQYKSGFRKFMDSEDWSKCYNSIKNYQNKLIDINPAFKPMIKGLTDELLVYRTRTKLNEMITKLKA